MKCQACGYEYNPKTSSEWSKNDGHGNWHVVGPEPFLSISPNVGCGGKWVTLYVCPACGTVRAE
jgi:hypothetical protein